MTETYALPRHRRGYWRSSRTDLHAPAFQVAASFWLDEDKIVDTFRSGEGLGWRAHNHRLFCVPPSFFGTGYRAHLVSEDLERAQPVTENQCHDV